MYIEVEQIDKNIKVIRKLKLKSLKKCKKVDGLKFNWKYIPSNENEKIEDFHLFCISIFLDVIENKFKTNEKGKIQYENIDKFINKKTLKKIKKMYSYILYEKNKLIKTE